MSITGTSQSTGAWVTADLIVQQFTATRDGRTSRDWTINVPSLAGNYFTEAMRHEVNKGLLGHGLKVVDFPTHPDGVCNGDVVLVYQPLTEDCTGTTCSSD